MVLGDTRVQSVSDSGASTILVIRTVLTNA